MPIQISSLYLDLTFIHVVDGVRCKLDVGVIKKNNYINFHKKNKPIILTCPSMWLFRDGTTARGVDSVRWLPQRLLFDIQANMFRLHIYTFLNMAYLTDNLFLFINEHTMVLFRDRWTPYKHARCLMVRISCFFKVPTLWNFNRATRPGNPSWQPVL
jgi:hypothetical protein